jgi:hypothetical protein
MERGRIEARGDAEVSAVAEDQFQCSRRLNDMMIRDGRQKSRTDMDWQEGGHIGLGRRRGWGGAASARATRRESGSETIEPIAKGVDGDTAELAELDVGQSRTAEIGEDSRPVDLVGRLSHGGASEESGAGPILTSLRQALKMRFTGRTRYASTKQRVGPFRGLEEIFRYPDQKQRGKSPRITVSKN